VLEIGLLSSHAFREMELILQGWLPRRLKSALSRAKSIAGMRGEKSSAPDFEKIRRLTMEGGIR
jgi:hypothetical protein